KTASQLARFSDLYAPGVTAEDALQVIDTLKRSYEVIEVVLSVKGDFANRILGDLQKRVPYVTLDTWVPELAAAATDQGDGADLWLAGKDEETATPAIFTTAMRYLPPGLDAWRKKKSPSEILIALCAPDAADRAGIDLLLGTEEIAKLISLADFRPDQEGGDESGLFTDLKKRDIPRIIVSIGRSSRAAEVARCVATYWGIEHVR